LQDEERQLIPIFHDEAIYYANDQSSGVWVKEDEQILRQKSKGRAIMVSDFICEEIGFLSCMSHGKNELARTIIEPGKNADGWWNAEKLLGQV
jgi:hypothetical protein